MWPVALPLAVGSLTGAFVGAKVAAYMPEDQLKMLFFISLLLLGGRNIVKAW